MLFMCSACAPSHTAACNHLTAHLFVAFLCLFFFFLLLWWWWWLQHSLFSHFCGPYKPSNRRCFRVFLKPSEQNTSDMPMFFCASEAQNHGIYNVFLFASGSKITVFTVFLCLCLAKALVFAQFSPCCKM